MGVVTLQREIFEREIGERRDRWIELYRREWSWLPAQLQSDLFDVIVVDVCVSESVDEFTGLEAGDLSHHHGQQRVRRDVEWNTEKQIGAPLIELTRKPAVTHVELK